MPATLMLKRDQNLPIELRRGRFEVSVDGKPVGSLDNHQTFEAQIAPGRHALQLHKGRYKSKEVMFEAPEGDTISFRCHGARIWPTWLLSYALPSLAISISYE
jgi:hypothetical protein